MLAATTILLPLAQSGDGFVRDRRRRRDRAASPRTTTVCIDWAIDNFDRYVTPTLEHLVLVVGLGRRRLR